MYNSLDVSQNAFDNTENLSPALLNRGPDVTLLEVPSPSLKRKRQETESSEMLRGDNGFRRHLKGLLDCVDDLKDLNVK